MGAGEILLLIFVAMVIALFGLFDALREDKKVREKVEIIEELQQEVGFLCDQYGDLEDELFDCKRDLAETASHCAFVEGELDAVNHGHGGVYSCEKCNSEFY